ncbi:MAG: IS66 family insertion sequence element accessory protein TnpA [Methylobacter sp.]
MSPNQNHDTMQVHITQWQVSSLSQAEYCKEHGIKPHIFNYYKKKFSPSVKQSSQLVPVRLLADEALLETRSSARNVLRLTHANGFSLEINPHTDMAFLRPLLELLRSVS